LLPQIPAKPAVRGPFHAGGGNKLFTAFFLSDKKLQSKWPSSLTKFAWSFRGEGNLPGLHNIQACLS
jgi:hypothetical protein